jgi:predicted DNA-binding protein with PD1-like motif
MANRWWVNGRRMAGVDPVEEKFSGPGSGFCLKSDDLNITSQINSESKKQSFSHDNGSNAAKADEERPAKGGAVATPRARGRPKGSKNKSKAPVCGTFETLDTLKSCVFEIPSGFDVRMTLETFALRHQMSVFILSGSGTVANVTLLQPAAPGRMVRYPGPLGILSMSGLFHHALGGTRITVILADRHGVMVAGRVVGSLVASDRIIVVTGIAADIPYERLNVNPLEAQPPGLFKSSVMSAAHQPIKVITEQQEHFQPPGLFKLSAMSAAQQPIKIMTEQQEVSLMSIDNVSPNLLNLGTQPQYPSAHCKSDGERHF